MAENSENFKNIQKRFDKDDLIQNPKKFVFQIAPENVEYVESLEYYEKQELINYLISLYKNGLLENEQKKISNLLIKKIIIITIAILLGIPLLFYLVNMSFSLTKSSYTDMQSNFQRLF